MNTSARDAGIPVLTEVIAAPDDAPAAAPAPAASPGYPAAPAPELGTPSQLARTAVSQELELRATTEWSQEQWKLLERHIRERILRQILDRIDALLDQRMRESTAAVVQVAISALNTEIKTSLHHSIEDVVTRAVSQEISRLQSNKK